MWISTINLVHYSFIVYGCKINKKNRFFVANTRKNIIFAANFEIKTK